MNTQGPESFLIEIERSRLQHLLQVFQDDYGYLAKHLRLMNERMVLVNPKFAQEPAKE